MNKLYPIIKDFKRIPTFVLMFILTFSTLGPGYLFAQTSSNQLNINVTISSPYSPFYSDYAGPNASKVLLLVQNLTATQKKIKLTGQLQGDNGIKITTKSNYVPLQPIILNPNETKQLNGLALKDIFDLNSLNVYGVDKVKLVQTSRLPEGNYMFCIQAVDMNTNQVISTGAPLGCSSITIMYPDAPFLMNPLSNTTVAPIAQTVSFSWGSNVVLPTGIEYTLQVVQMPDERRDDPNRVLEASSGLGLLINKKVFNRTSVGLIELGLPDAFKFGKRYAWRVIAADPSGKIIFKNKGISPANEFRYGEKPPIASSITLKSPEVDEGIEKLDELAFKWSFTDNSSQNDNIGFYNGGFNNTSNSSNNKYELYLNKLKSGAQKLTEQKERDEKISSLKKSLQQTNPTNIAKITSLYNEIQNIQQNPLTIYADKGIVVTVDKDNIDFKSSPAIATYLKDGSDYQWSVKHIGTGTVSQSRNFMLRSIDRGDYKLSLAGNLRYNFRDQYLAGASKRTQIKNEIIPAGQSSKIILTEDEKGYPLSSKNIQVLRATFLAPLNKIVNKITVKENGVDKEKSETVDRIDPLSDLSISYGAAQKENNTQFVTGGTTDSNGNFNIEVPVKLNQYKVIDPNVIVNGKNYALVQGLVIRVNDNHFSDPNWFVVPNDAGTILNLGEGIVQIFDYKLEVGISSKIQKNYKGKLYLLRDEAKLIKGEVQNRPVAKKEIPLYTTQIQMNDNNPTLGVVKNGIANYNIVGVQDVEFSQNNSTPHLFSKLATATYSTDDYTLYFEPGTVQESLYFDPQKISNLGLAKLSYQGTDFAKKDILEKVSFGPKFISMQISGRYVYNWLKPVTAANPKLPLPEGTRLKLVKGNMPQRTVGDVPEFTNQKLVASTTVKKNGEYTFDVPMQFYADFNNLGGEDLVIAIDSKYYYADPVTINTNAEKNITMPELTATVRQFSFTSKVSYIDASVIGGETRNPDPLNVYLCREIDEIVPLDRPKNEGDPARNTYPKKIYELKDQQGKIQARYEIINKVESGKGGIFRFDGLIVPNANNENYHVFAEPISGSSDNFQSVDDYTIIRSFTSARIELENMKKGTLGNEQYITTIDYTRLLTPWLNVQPMSPYIDGAVYPNSNASTTVLTKVLVEMFDMPTSVQNSLKDEEYALKVSGQTPKTYITGDNGRFLFENIRVKGDKYLNGLGVTKIAGDQPWKLLRFTKQGFLPTYYPVNSGKPLAKGQLDKNAQKIFMNLPKDIYVTVKNSNKQKIDARIIVGDDFSWMDYSTWAQLDKTIAKTPKGLVKFTIIPADKVNYKTTTSYKTITDGTKALNFSDATKNLDFEVANLEHKILVQCYIKGTNTFLRANVSVLNAAKFTAVINNNYQGQGITTEVTIPVGSTQFDLKVVPENLDYTIAKTQVYSNGMGVTRINVEVEPAATLTIKATEEYMNYVSNGLFGTFEKAKRKASNYSFYIDGLDDDEYEVVNPYGTGPLALVTMLSTDTRVVRRLPLSMYVNVRATKEGFLGGAKKITSFGSKQLSATLDLKISELDVNSMQGFPIELVAAIKQNNGQYLISGRLNPNAGSNGNLKAKSTTGKLEFNRVLVDVFKISGRGTVIAPVKPLTFEQNSIEAILFDNYNVKITSKDGLTLRTLKDKGSIVGKVAIDPGSLSKGVALYSSMDISKNYLYLSDAARPAQTVYADLKDYQESNDLETFSTAKTDMAASKYWVSTLSGSLPVFTGPDDFLITPDKYVEMVSSGIRFNGAIKTNLANVADTSRNINAKAFFTINRNDIYTVGQEKFQIKLRDWYLKVEGWGYGPTGFNADGKLYALGLTIPFIDLNIFKDKIGFGKFDITTLKLLNTFKVDLNSAKTSVSFGYDKGFSNTSGAWSVSVLSETGSAVASIKALPDLALTDEIKIKNISLYDTGDENDTRILLDEKQAPVTLNGIAKFRPGSMSGSSTMVKFRGDLNMDIPGFTGLEAVTYDLKFEVGANAKLIHVDDKPFQNLGLDTKGIKVTFDGTQSFKNGKLELTGVLRDKDPLATDKYEIPVKLLKELVNSVPTTTLTAIDNKIYLNKNDKSIYLDGASGSTYVNTANQWEYFKFGGLLTQKTTGVAAEDGIKPSKMDFVIKGEVIANTSAIGIKNMGAGPLTGFSIVYDFNEKALIGSGHLSQDIKFAKLDLDAELKIGNATDWYIFSSGKAEVYNVPMFKELGVAFMVGNTKITDSQRAGFYKHFAGNIKPSDQTLSAFQGQLKGVLFMGSMEMKLPLLPTFNLDLAPIASVEFNNGLYAATYFKLNFAEGAEITVGGRVGAYVQLSAGASIGLACAGVSLRAEAGAEVQASLNPINGNFAAMLALKFQLEGNAYVGVGLCTSSCNTIKVFGIPSPIKCYRKQYGKVLTIGVEASLNNNGLSLTGSGQTKTEN